jgi:TetR/AcrR family transcriptional repressor of nem operon
MARKKNADLEKTKQNLLEIGIALLQEKGYNATGIQEIAIAANIPKGSFYNYFSSKEKFGVAVIRHYSEVNTGKWLTLLQEATEKENSYKALSSAFLAVTEQYRCAEVKKGCLLGTLAAEISEASEECRLALQEATGEFRRILAEHLFSGQQLGKVRQDIAAEHLADLVWDCWQGSLLRMKVEKSVEPVNQNLEILFHHILVL